MLLFGELFAHFLNQIDTGLKILNFGDAKLNGFTVSEFIVAKCHCGFTVFYRALMQGVHSIWQCTVPADVRTAPITTEHMV